MKNTKFRKRALLSSVAMLLVALVALGSATFAWFTDDPDADAKGIKVQANTGLGLVASTDTDAAWTHHATLYKNIADDFILTPATTANNGTTFWTARAAAETASAIKTTDGEKWSSVNVVEHTAGSGVYHEQVHLKTTAGSKAANIKLTNVKINGTGKAMTPAVTVLLMNGSTLVGYYNTAGTAIGKWTTLSASTACIAAPSTQTCTASNASTAVTLWTNVAAGTVKDLDVYVFLDGSHAQVYTNNASADELVSGVELYFTAEEYTAP